MYNAALRPSAPRYSPRLSSSPYNAIQRFVMYNATNDATWLSAPQRFATRLSVLRRASIQLNDFFVTPHRGSPLLNALNRNATQRFVCYNASPRGSALHWALRLPAAHRASTQLNDLFVNLLSRLDTALLCAARYDAAPRSATQRFVCQFILASSRSATRLPAALRFATQRFVYYDATTTLLSSPTRTSSRLCARPRSSIQRNELKLN